MLIRFCTSSLIHPITLSPCRCVYTETNRFLSASRSKQSHIPKKLLSKISAEDEHWQRTQSIVEANGDRVSNTNRSTVRQVPSYNKLKNTQVDSRLINFIDKHQLGLRRFPRRKPTENRQPRDLSHIGRKILSRSSQTPSSRIISVDKIFSRHYVEFVTSAYNLECPFPIDDIVFPEVCFIGRSNVGKSSLLNAISNWAIARTSTKPGLTQSINWYSLHRAMHLVDLPGYGFAFAPSKNVENWTELVKTYLATRKSLKLCFVLIDARQVLKASDLDLMTFLDVSKTTYQIIITKADLLKPVDLARCCQFVQDEIANRRYAKKQVYMVSAKNRAGLAYLRNELVNLISPEVRETIVKQLEKREIKCEKRITQEERRIKVKKWKDQRKLVKVIKKVGRRRL